MNLRDISKSKSEEETRQYPRITQHNRHRQLSDMVRDALRQGLQSNNERSLVNGFSHDSEAHMPAGWDQRIASTSAG